MTAPYTPGRDPVPGYPLWYFGVLNYHYDTETWTIQVRQPEKGYHFYVDGPSRQECIDNAIRRVRMEEARELP